MNCADSCEKRIQMTLCWCSPCSVWLAVCCTCHTFRCTHSRVNHKLWLKLRVDRESLYRARAWWTWSKPGWLYWVLSTQNLLCNSKFVHLALCYRPQDTIPHLIRSMPRRCQACMQAREGHTNYWVPFWVAAMKFELNGLVCCIFFSFSLWFSGCLWIQSSVGWYFFLSIKRCGILSFLTHYPVHISIDIQHDIFPHWDLMCFQSVPLIFLSSVYKSPLLLDLLVINAIKSHNIGPIIYKSQILLKDFC